MLDMDDTVCNSENAENENDLVDNQDFLHNKAIPFDVKMNDTLHEQKVPKEVMKKFHKSMQYCILYQWTVCHEAWPLCTRPKQPHNYVCSRCSRDKSVPKEFSQENSMIPFPVPKELQGLTQFEEMLIARAFPVMHVYTKPRDGQKSYKGHVITLPQDVQQLADVLPQCPQELPVIVTIIVFTIAGKDNKS